MVGGDEEGEGGGFLIHFVDAGAVFVYYFYGVGGWGGEAQRERVFFYR